MKNLEKPVTILENEHWRVKIYFPPKEHPPAHVHVFWKGKKGVQMTVFLETLEVKASKEWSKKAIKKVLNFIYDNFDLLIERWEEIHESKN